MTKVAITLLIKLLAANGRLECSKKYPPANMLITNGYAEWVEDIDGKTYLEINRWSIHVITNGQPINYQP